MLDKKVDEIIRGPDGKFIGVRSGEEVGHGAGDAYRLAHY